MKIYPNPNSSIKTNPNFKVKFLSVISRSAMLSIFLNTEGIANVKLKIVNRDAISPITLSTDFMIKVPIRLFISQLK